MLICFAVCLQRAVDSLDPHDLNGDKTSSAQIYKDGHAGLLSTDVTARVEKLTTVRDSYRPPQGPNVRQIGKFNFYSVQNQFDMSNSSKNRILNKL